MRVRPIHALHGANDAEGEEPAASVWLLPRAVRDELDKVTTALGLAPKHYQHSARTLHVMVRKYGGSAAY